jgi:hypothetical protein
VWGRQQQGESLVASRKRRRSGSPIPSFFLPKKIKINKMAKIKKKQRSKTKQNKFLDKKNTIKIITTSTVAGIWKSLKLYKNYGNYLWEHGAVKNEGAKIK